LSLEATAESAGRKGESIVVRNPATGKSFRAVVEQKGKVIVKSSTGA
jgi:flagella basal body P-ring formation protein FlgA